MDLQQRVSQHFEQSVLTQQKMLDEHSALIAVAAQRLAECLLSGGKILCCGIGGSASQAQYFASLLLNRYDRERPGLPALAVTADTASLTAIASDHSYKEIFSQQVRALGQEQDTLLLMCSTRSTRNLVEALHAGHDRGMNIIAMTSDESHRLADLLQSDDIEIRVPVTSRVRCQEVHLTIIHCLCDLIDIQIFGEEL